MTMTSMQFSGPVVPRVVKIRTLFDTVPIVASDFARVSPHQDGIHANEPRGGRSSIRTIVVVVVVLAHRRRIALLRQQRDDDFGPASRYDLAVADVYPAAPLPATCLADGDVVILGSPR